MAAHKLAAVLKFTRNIVILAEKISVEIKNLGLEYREEKYQGQDLREFSLVYACTNNREVNKQILADARKLGILVNVADDPDLCDFISPAIFKQDEITVAVSSGSKNVKKAVDWRNRIKDWASQNLH